MYHETDTVRYCYNCRWCDGGRECRFFDTDRDRAEFPSTAVRCPFFEARGPAARVRRICEAINRLAAAVEELRAAQEQLQAPQEQEAGR